jgi:hypothetical protein
MKRRSLPIRRTPVRKVRPGTRRGQPTKEHKGVARFVAYEQAGGRCELSLHPQHLSGVLPYTGDIFERAHLVHVRSRGAGGTWEPENLKIGCYWCHIISLHQYGGATKPVPPKEPK